MESNNDDKQIINKLIHKVSEQALELNGLTAELEKYQSIDRKDISTMNLSKSIDFDSTLPSYHNKDKDHLFSSTSISEHAIQRKQELQNNQLINSLQKQLELSESKLSEVLKTKKKMLNDIEIKSRELNFYMKQCKIYETENQSLKLQIEQTLKMQSLSASKSNKKGHDKLMKNIDAITYYKTCDKLDTLKLLNNQLHQEINQYKDNENQLKARIKVLEDALEFRSEEIGLSGHSDLLTKVIKLRQEVQLLKQDIIQKDNEMYEMEESKTSIAHQHDVLKSQIKLVHIYYYIYTIKYTIYMIVFCIIL